MYKRASFLIISMVLIVNVTIETAIADPNLVGWWNFDEASSSTAIDSSGNGYDGTITGAVKISGVDGNALDFAGDDYVTIPSAVFANIANEITIAFWQYGDDSLPVANSILYGANAAGNRVLNAHVPWSNGSIILDAGHSGSGDTTDTNYDRITKSADSAEDYKGQWNHWAFTKNTVTGEMKAYLNGLLWSSGTGKTKLMSGITQFTIGAKYDLTSNYPGMIDDFRIYDRALSATEIQIMTGLEMNCTPTGADLNGDCKVDFKDVRELAQMWLLSDQIVHATAPNNSRLQAFYLFNENSGTIAHDSSGKQRHATIDANNPSTIWAAGYQTGFCINFDGASRIAIPATVFSAISNELTISAWVNTGANVVSSVDFAAGPSDANLWDRINWITTDVNDSNNQGGWVHYAFVKDADSSVMRIYRNGLIIAGDSHAEQPIDGAGAGISYIGSASDGSGDYFVGKVDDFRVYNYALPQSEIIFLAAGSSGQVSQPIAPYIVPLDPHEDGTIDYRDFSILADQWLQNLATP